MRMTATARIAAIASAFAATIASAHAATLVVADVQVDCGEQVQVPIHVEGASGLETFGLNLSYSTSCFEFVSIAPGTATDDWAGIEAAENVDGIVTLGGFRGSAPAVSGSAEIAVLTFACIEQACPCASPLQPGAFVSGIAGYQTSVAFATCSDGQGVCTTAVQPGGRSFGPDGGQGTIGVSAPAGCPWLVTEDAPWITITLGNGGVGNGQVGYTVAPLGEEDPRQATIFVSGASHVVTQFDTDFVATQIAGAIGFTDVSGASAESTLPDGTTEDGFVAQEKKTGAELAVDLSGLVVDASQNIGGIVVVEPGLARGAAIEMPATGRLSLKEAILHEGESITGSHSAKASVSAKNAAKASVSLKGSAKGDGPAAKAIVGPPFAGNLKASDGEAKGASKVAFSGWPVGSATIAHPIAGPTPNGSPASSWEGEALLVTPFEDEPVGGGELEAKTKWSANGKPGSVSMKATVGAVSGTLKGTTSTTAAEAAATGFGFEDAEIEPAAITLKGPGVSSKTTIKD